MKYWRGPFVWNAGAFPSWNAPDGAIGLLDLRSIPQQSQAGGNPGLGIFVTKNGVDLSSDYDLLGAGNWRDIKPNQRTKDAIPKRKGYSLKGDDLLGNLLDVLTDGADPTGEDFAKPIMPARGKIELHLAGAYHAQQFTLGKGHANRVLSVIQQDMNVVIEDSASGKLKDKEHHRRVLDYICDKFGTDDWQQFVPPNLRKEVNGRLRHATVITESFDTANSTTLGPDQSWTEVRGSWEVVSNAVSKTGGSNVDLARCDSDLSSSDHFAEVSISGGNDGSFCGPAARCPSSSTLTFYFVANFVNLLYVTKMVAGTQTNISATSHTFSIGDKYTVHCNGSTIKGLASDVEKLNVTDTSISGNIRCGITQFGTSASATMDNWRAEDGDPGGANYTQLERSTRGILRGVYTRY